MCISYLEINLQRHYKIYDMIIIIYYKCRMYGVKILYSVKDMH